MYRDTWDKELVYLPERIRVQNEGDLGDREEGGDTREAIAAGLRRVIAKHYRTKFYGVREQVHDMIHALYITNIPAVAFEKAFLDGYDPMVEYTPWVVKELGTHVYNRMINEIWPQQK
jgi:hypothetical protein